MLLCFIVILFICVVVGVIKYSTAHSLKQEKTLSYLRLIMKIYNGEVLYRFKAIINNLFPSRMLFCSMEMSEMLEIKRIENFNALL